jgi:branched-chain amino acid aminotransferase
MYIYLNGQFVDEKHATVSVFDRGFLYGDGVFETMRAYQGRIAWLEQHLDRLFQSAEMIYLRIRHSKQDFTAVLQELIDRNTLDNALIRITLTRGITSPGLDPEPDSHHTTVITTRPYLPYPATHYADGVSVVIVTVRRNLIDAVSPRIKSLNFLNSILAKAEATQKGAVDGIMLNQDNYLTEATTSNLFLVRHGELFTPAVTCGILEGITRNVVVELAEANGTSCHQQPLTVEELYSAEECFLTNTSMELMPVTQVDDRMIGNGRPGPVTNQLHDEFQLYVTQYISRSDRGQAASCGTTGS